MASEEFLPIAALQHLLFCERQCALIHVEGIWAENRLTAEGRVLHETVNRGERTSHTGVTVERDVALCSERLGLYGRADVVEFGRDRDGGLAAFPVEYKRGRRTPRRADEVQLCAQALCLEEMLERPVPRGAIYHGVSRHRRQVEFAPDLRAATEHAVVRLRELVTARVTPRPRPGPMCRSCSLAALCLPAATADPTAASGYLEQLTRR